MTTRNLPKIEAFSEPSGIDWDCPIQARENWQSLRAKHEDERTLAITDEIGDRGDGRGVTVNFVRGFLRRVGSGPVTVNINSPGGSFFEGLAIYNLLREHDGNVNTNVLGVAASAASIIAMASDELRVAKAGFLMIHNAWAIALGNRNDMRATADLLEQFDNSMASIYSDRSGIPVARIAKFMDEETFFNGEKAVDLGLADTLLASDEVEADEDPPEARAERLADIQFQKANMPRSERRALLSRLKGGKRGAAADTMPCAGIDSLVDELRDLTEAIKT